MSTFAFAGGDIAPVEPMIETPMVEEASTPGSFYVGAAYGMANLESTNSYDYLDGTFTDTVGDFDYDTVMLQAGYKFNQYIAIEGRYWFGMGEDIGATYDANGNQVDSDYALNIDTWAIYAKPMYPVTEQFDIYGLLGYASTEVKRSYSDSRTYTPGYDMDGFSWGLGGAYAFTENVAIFVDYVNMYDDSNTFNGETYNGTAFTANTDDVLSTVNFGVTYTF